MFTVKLKDGTAFTATVVEENFRPRIDGKSIVSLVIQSNEVSQSDSDINTYKAKFTTDNLSNIDIFARADDAKPVKTYTGYVYIWHLTSRILPSGNSLLSFCFAKEDMTKEDL